MNNEHIKEILSAYRDDLPVDESPGVAEALAALETDADLRAWFDEEKRFDEEFGAALNAIPLPAGLAQRILEEAPASSALEATPETKVVRFPRRRLWWAAAAAVVFTAVSLVKYFAFPPPVDFPGSTFTSAQEFREDMAYYANSRFVLAHMTKDLTDARDWLKKHHSPTYEETPHPIVEFEGMGCTTFKWGPHQVSLVCFENESSEIVHLFVVDKSALSELLPADELQANEVLDKLETGGWMTESKLYLFVGSEPHVKIGEILDQIGKA